MNNYYNQVKFLTTAALVFLIANPSKAANRQIADVNLNSNGNSIELRLKTGERTGDKPSFFTVSENNILKANLINTELKLPQGKTFSHKNPSPDIAEIKVQQLDKNNTQIAISGKKGVAVEPTLKQQEGEIVLSLISNTKAKKSSLKSTLMELKSSLKDALAQLPKPKEKVYTSPANNNSSSTNPNVLVPNPEIIISEQGNNSDNPLQPTQPTQPYLPRAVAPPVGDMSVSNINASPDILDLGTGAIVPRLVLRDAPVREVLSLLARSAGLNLVFTDNQASTETEGSGEGEGAQIAVEATEEKTISLDLENEPVQEVFNSVLLVSGMNANRQGNTIYVGSKLPSQARNLVTRTLRLNQVRAENAALFLASQGAEGQRLTTEVEEVIDPETGRVSQRTEKPAQLTSLREGLDTNNTVNSAHLLRGLQVATDDRLNSITLIGEPRKVEIATAFLTQLDARRRQVAVNVKVLDVNLDNQDVFNSSFSFGINDSFFVQDNGAATLRFGESSPVRAVDINSDTGRISNPPVIANPFADANIFFDFDGSGIQIPDTTRGLIDLRTGTITPRGTGTFPSGTAGTGDPFTAGVTEFTTATFDILDVDSQGNLTLTEGEDGTATLSLPSLFQTPDKFLALLEARVVSGNAKILTDPTLVVQEGQEATVKLVQEVIKSVETEIDSESGIRTITPIIDEAGLTLNVNIEQIDDNGFISLSVNPRVTSVGVTQDFDSGGGAVNTLNLLSNRELNSGLVRLRDGQTLILSGIIQDQERTTVSKVPILGDIPLLGSLFRSTTKDNERAEVIVLLTPQVIDEQSGFGYNYKPGKEAREMLQQRGFQPSPGNGQ